MLKGLKRLRWQQFDLLFQLIRRDISARYRGSLMGGLWAIVSPLVMLLVYTFVFGVVFQARWGAGGGQGNSGFALNLFAGMLVHGLIAECLSRSPALIVQHSSYVKRVVFPLWILPLVVVGGALFQTAIGFGVLLAAMLLLGQLPHWELLALPLLLLPLLLLAVGLGWLLSALGAYVRDIGHLMPMIITVLMFLSPVFYSVEAIPEAYRSWMYLNPLTPAIEAMRALLFGGDLPSVKGYLTYLGATALFAAATCWIFNRLRRGFSDVL